MKPNKWTSRLACTILVVGTIAGVALAAGTQGSQSDPLVTLSYLNEVALPGLLKQVDQKLDARESELTQKLQSAAGNSQASFVAVELSAGKTLTLSAGAQLLFRSGAAASTAALADTTDGTTLSGTGALTANHLYLATGDGQSVTASAASTVLVQGSYSLK